MSHVMVEISGACTAAWYEPPQKMAKESALPPAFVAGHIALIGRPNVGKSTLLNAIVGEPIAITSPQPQTTRDRIRGICTTKDAQYVFVDTPGIHSARNQLGKRMVHAQEAATRDAEVVGVVIDVGRDRILSLRVEDEALLRAQAAEKPTMCIINKVDQLADKSALLPLLAKLGEIETLVAVVPISARNHDGVDRILAEARKHLPESPPLFDADSLTDKPVRFFVTEFVREQILKQTRQEIPHGVAVAVERFDESKPIVHVDLVVHVPRDSHKKIVIGKGGEMLKRIGTDARARIEAMLQRQVFLRIFVRVTPGWQESDALLSELGFEKPELP